MPVREATPSQAQGTPEAGLIALPGLVAVAHLPFTGAKGTEEDDASLMELAGDLGDGARQLLAARLASGAVLWLLGLGVVALGLGLRAFDGDEQHLLVRHVVLAVTSVGIASAGLALCVSLRAAALGALVGGVALALSVCAGTWLARRGSTLGTALAGAAIAGGLGGAAALLDRQPQRPRGAKESFRVPSLRDRLAAICDALLLLAALSLVAVVLSLIVNQALQSAKSTGDVLKQPAAALLGLMLGAPFLLATWRRLIMTGLGEQVSKAYSKGAGVIALLGAAGGAAVGADPRSIGYAAGLGVLVGGLSAGIFTLFWQWTDWWRAGSRRGVAALIGTVATILSLVMIGAFNRNYDPQRQTLATTVSTWALAGYLSVAAARLAPGRRSRGKTA